MTTTPVTLGPVSPVPGLPQPKPAPPARAAAVGHWLRDTGLGITGFLVVLVVAVAGWTASFIGLHDFGDRKMGLSGGEAWLVPITFDGAALGLSLVVFRASIHGRGASMWRLLIVVFTVLSAWINYKHISDPTGRWIASFMPPSAVVLFEGLMSEARAAASRRLGRERPRLHPLRWVIDRKGTWTMYRAYVLGIEVPKHLKRTPPERPRERPDERTKGAPPEPAESAREERPPSARKSAPAKPKRAPKKSALRERRMERTEALYATLGRRPEWTEIRDALVADRLAPKDISRPVVQRIREAVEKANPKLAALGSKNVRPLKQTGS